jgi:hypothetical protein
VTINIENFDLKVTLLKGTQINKLSLRNNNLVDKNFTISLSQKKVSRNIVINELVLNNVTLNYAIIQGQKDFLILKSIELMGEGAGIKGILKNEINSSINHEKVELKTGPNERLFYPIKNGSFEVEPVFITSYFSNDRIQFFRISKKEIYVRSSLGIAVFIVMIWNSLKLIQRHKCLLL